MNFLKFPTSIPTPSLRYHGQHPSHPLKTSVMGPSQTWSPTPLLRGPSKCPISASDHKTMVGPPLLPPSQSAITWGASLLPMVLCSSGTSLSLLQVLSLSEGSLDITRMLCPPICCDGCDCSCLSPASACLVSHTSGSRPSQVTPFLPPPWAPNSPPCCPLHSSGPQLQMLLEVAAKFHHCLTG